jgi:hypothetical protein
MLQRPTPVQTSHRTKSTNSDELSARSGRVLLTTVFGGGKPASTCARVGVPWVWLAGNQPSGRVSRDF